MSFTFFVYLRMGFLYALIILVGAIACFLWWKLAMFLFWPKKKTLQEVNPYIEAHKLKVKNDENYDEYIDWLDKNGGGIPFSKIQTKEDIEAEKKINNLIK